MRKVTFEVVGYGTVVRTEHGTRGLDFSFYFQSLAIQVGAPSLDVACAMVDEVVSAEREAQVSSSMW